MIIEEKYTTEYSNTKPLNYLELYTSKVNNFYSYPDYGLIFRELGIGKNMYLTALFNKNITMISELQENVIGGTLISNLPKILLNSFNKFNYLKILTGHLQPMVLTNLPNDIVKSLEASVSFIDEYSSKKGLNVLIDFVLFKNREDAEDFLGKNKNLKLCATGRIDLTREESEIFNNFHLSLKRHLKNKKHTTNITEVSYKEFYKHLKKSYQSKNLSINQQNYYEKLHKLPNQIVKYFIIYDEDKVALAGSALGFGNNSVTEFSMFATLDSRDLKIPGGDLLKWDLIKKSKKRGCHYFDMNMIEINETEDDKVQNINFYKTKWGIEIIYGVKFEKYNTISKVLRNIKLRIFGK